MAFLDRFGWKKRIRLSAGRKAWWETAGEFSPPGAFYEPEMDFDPLGSYTGVPDDNGEPVQDADDL